jgi:hypothetical protein
MRQRRPSRVVQVVAIATIVAGCVAEEPPDPSDPPWDEPVAGAVAVTDWQDDGTPTSPFGPSGPGWDSPELIVTALAESLGRGGDARASGVVVSRSDAGTAVGWVRIEVPEDAAIALDIQLEIRESEGSWSVVSIESREHCSQPLVAGDCQ